MIFQVKVYKCITFTLTFKVKVPPLNKNNENIDDKMNPSVSPNSSIFDPPSNDILEYPATSTKRINSNDCSDDKINYSVSSNLSISDPSSNDILEYPASSTKEKIVQITLQMTKSIILYRIH